jgi:hypothetical protein
MGPHFQGTIRTVDEIGMVMADHIAFADNIEIENAGERRCQIRSTSRHNAEKTGQPTNAHRQPEPRSKHRASPPAGTQFASGKPQEKQQLANETTKFGGKRGALNLSPKSDAGDASVRNAG